MAWAKSGKNWTQIEGCGLSGNTMYNEYKYTGEYLHQVVLEASKEQKRFMILKQNTSTIMGKNKQTKNPIL